MALSYLIRPPLSCPTSHSFHFYLLKYFLFIKIFGHGEEGAKSHEKVEMSRMNNEEDLLVSFSTRRSGIYIKASEFFTLCGTEVGISAFSPNGEPFSFGHPCIKSVTNKLLSEIPYTM